MYLALNCVGGEPGGLEDGLYVLTKRARAKNFPAATAADQVFTSECGDEPWIEEGYRESTGYYVQGLAGLPHGRVGVLYFVVPMGDK